MSEIADAIVKVNREYGIPVDRKYRRRSKEAL